MIPESKLPSLGTTIFSQMSALAQQHQAINLSQGFPDFDGPRYLQERLAYHVAQGANQYAPMTGVAALREAIVDKTEELYGYRPDANSDVTVTAGATEALYAAITALVRAGDEVICFDPSYDSYAPAIELSGGVLKRIALQPPHFRVDWQQFAASLNDKTRLVILNTPHNPSATVWLREDFAALWQAIADREIYVLSDEVYEHICFAAEGHASVLAHPQLRERAVAVSSFGKTFHMTGWKVGYCVAPAAISGELRKVHQYLTFAVNTPAQLAIADMLRREPEHYRQLPAFYRERRDLFIDALRSSRLEILPCEGTYFLLADYSAVSDLDDVSFCRWLTTEIGVAAIPLSVFCADPFPHKLIRLCFAKQPATLLAAAERLCRL
ncbi:pyridoxal phosphate-dependent aminotransferase [Klebsiella grimontii]|uniref:Pyridoxal phosphate-dependent aminotransferase n=1 Tax=Klebsiella grimontii TaxID=2058152 RepID=A0A7W3H1J0_9ENTR|nr:pyridoxal phosphate-dependent aminotransferase [Klebsiella grimontii]MBS6570225.1 pyridoxal phosphate-dependent aminotransferase [Klebsiella michiganensis]MBA8009011.1 pyridoxal phosphate-dependent aminotransferase [Klebsiella grimontii]MBA8122588.1 pyridoxal phosphate-dependent aminotransferase [Klebsiella grimontii]MBE8891725.1 pyridoxal phosphate-dependent aminotransferase [Klebsiella grimontii]MDU4231242.1 pyridoxal phosphate-dependent aminotransferase [Klebsiella grimontii]